MQRKEKMLRPGGGGWNQKALFGRNNRKIDREERIGVNVLIGKDEELEINKNCWKLCF